MTNHLDENDLSDAEVFAMWDEGEPVQLVPPSTMEATTAANAGSVTFIVHRSAIVRELVDLDLSGIGGQEMGGDVQLPTDAGEQNQRVFA